MVSDGTTLTLVVPCFNSARYVRRCLDSILTGVPLDGVEVIVVNDGSTDETAAIAEEYRAGYPGVVRAVHQENGGHGEAINTGLRLARGEYVKIVDSDDWLDAEALLRTLATLEGLRSARNRVDVLVTNFVYEQAQRRRSTRVGYTGVLPTSRVFGWGEVGRFSKRQYMLMHSLTYRTDLLRESALVLPAHTFYVDNLYAYLPLRHVRRMYYLDVDLYRYVIGRSDQSVNEGVMLSRLDQQLAVNRAMLPALEWVRKDPRSPRELRRYMLHHFEIVSAVSSILLIKAGTRAAMTKKEQFWSDVQRADPGLHRRLRRSMFGQLTHLPGRPGRRISVLAYRVAQRAVGFN